METAEREGLWKIAESYYFNRDWAHGKQHVQRIVSNALRIAKLEQADLDIVEAAAILHDIFEYKEAHSDDENFKHEIEGAREARRILSSLGYDSRFVDAVCHCIESHRKRRGPEPETIEAKCLFDADKLDAIGAIGVLRSAFVAFDHAQEVYRDEPDIEAYRRKNIRSDGTIIDSSQHSCILEYELSLKHIPDQMYTKTGKRLAHERAALMATFYSRLKEETMGT